MTIIYPPKKLKINNNPIVFLAGPIQDSVEWHSKAIDYFEKYAPNLNIACPKRPKGLNNEFVYEEQVNWETEYLNLSSKNGGILFWLGNQEKANAERSYAQTTRFEIAEWFTKFKTNKDINIVVGVDTNFPGERYIKYRIETEAPEIPIVDSLDYAVLTMVKKIYNE